MPSLNPRTGENIDKPAAPLHLRAFLAAVRSVNAGWLTRLAKADGIPAAAAELLARGPVDRWRRVLELVCDLSERRGELVRARVLGS